ncbi:MAG: nucleoside hydrolase [Thermoguttaceae bacterium]|nr:nucleoside hydrolase [Thermoguttaceae bacterium]
MRRKLLIDLSPGIEQTLALWAALRNPNLEVLAVTSSGGNVDAARAGQNLYTVLNLIDPSPRPRLGVGEEPLGGLSVDGSMLNGKDGLGDVDIPVVELLQRPSAAKIIVDVVKSYPNEVTILALGPLTNVARALALDPDIASLIGHLVVCGGSLSAQGNITPCAEFNMYCDPRAAQEVFQSKLTKTLVPIDVASRFSVGLDVINQIVATESGSRLKKMLFALYRNYRQWLGREKIFVNSSVALISILHPDLFVRQKLFVDVETAGELTTGMTVFDQRIQAPSRPNTEVITDFDKHVLKMFFAEEMRIYST